MTTFLLITAGAGALYAASWLGARALAFNDPARPGWRAVGHWLPIAVAVLAAAAMRSEPIAMGLLFATSVACLSLMLGLLAYFSSLEADRSTRRAWPFVMPAALLALLAGFSAHLTLLHAGMLLLLGLAVWSVWTDPDARRAEEPIDQAMTPPGRGIRAGLVALAIVLAVAGGWAAVYGAVRAGQVSRLLPAGLVAAAVLSPLLTMPMLSSASILSQRNQTDSMGGTLVGVVLLNLCLLLPATILVWHFQPSAVAVARTIFSDNAAELASSQPAVDDQYLVVEPHSMAMSVTAETEPLPYPIAVWRVDTVLILILGFALLPVAMGRWTLGRNEGAALIVGYVIYLAVVMALPRMI